MHFEDILPGSYIQLEISGADNTDIVDAQVKAAKKNVIVLEPIIIDGRVLVLDSSNITVNVFYEESDDKPDYWKNVKYNMVNISSKPMIALASANESVKYNRRTNFRIPMGVQGRLNGKDTVVVSDISSTGISFLGSLEKDYAIGTEFKLSFNAHYTEYVVSGQIVRKDRRERNMLYGCTIKSNPQIDELISYEQRSRLAKNRR